MPTSLEVRAQLTGPGGMFEVVTEDVLGRPTQVYASLGRRLVASLALTVSAAMIARMFI